MKIKNTVSKVWLNVMFFLLTISWLILSTSTSASAQNDITFITKNLPLEEVQEFNKHHQMSYKLIDDVKAAFLIMSNPYHKILSQDKYEYVEGAKVSSAELTLYAKASRFDNCQEVLVSFDVMAETAKILLANKVITNKEGFFVSRSKSYEIDYPFSEQDSKDELGRPTQLMLELAWKYRGRGKENFLVFFDACLNLPLEIFRDEE